ncbi:MAG: DMT family transporter [Desulfococcaceae bacterium]|jgi:drug/metabolite transporter (DMT)-like permease|nr:DMT family transporter [Desulfococcaceae bacterium]
MDKQVFKSNCLLMLTATIWGLAFVAQRMGMDHVGPFTYNGIRFALGSISLLPLLYMVRRQEKKYHFDTPESKTVILSGLLLGCALFAGASLQQVGLVYTTAGNAGFITGLYVVIVPLLGLFWKQRTDSGTWIGAVLAAVGLYFLSVTDSFTIAFGDLLELIGAFFWAGHVLLIAWMSPKINAIRLSLVQFAVCSVLSLLTAFVFEEIRMQGIMDAAVPIFYGGFCSVGIAYTLQVVAQKYAKPAHAAIILSMESPFAAVGGWIILQEILTGRAFFGCAMMLAGMLVSQLYPHIRAFLGRKAEVVS